MAVLAVVAYHAGVSAIPGGYVGVDIFFVISGFLITSHLLSMLERSGRISFVEFYARRIRRILPASVVVLLLTAIASIIFVPRVDVPGILEDAAATALYVPNLLFAVQGTDYLAEKSPSPLQHYWSLGVEEQFYLLWPAVIVAVFVVVRRSIPRLGLVLAALVLLSFAYSLQLLAVSQPWAFFSLPSRAWELGVGGLVAMLVPRLRMLLSPSAGTALSWAGLAGILAGFLFLSASSPFPGTAALIPVLSTAAVILGGSYARPAKLLAVRPMQMIGRWSYSLYLVHWPLLTIPQLAVGVENQLPLGITLGLGALSLPLAIALHVLVEERFRNPKASAHNRKRHVSVIASAVVVGMILGIASIGLGRHIDQSPATTDAQAERTAGELYPEGGKVVPKNITPILEQATASVPRTNGDGCHAPATGTELQVECVYGKTESSRDVVLFGDSHAAQWFSAVEEYAVDSSSRLHNFTKSSCPAVQISIVNQGTPYESCDTWRERALSAIREMKPRLVILGNYGRVVPVDESTSLLTQWEDGLRATIEQMPRGTQVVVLADTPHHGSAPASCLSRNLESAHNCDLPIEDAFDAARTGAERRVSQETGALYLDMTKYLCSESCPTIIGDILAYRDEHHLTVPMVDALAAPLAEQLAGAEPKTTD